MRLTSQHTQLSSDPDTDPIVRSAKKDLKDNVAELKKQFDGDRRNTLNTQIRVASI